MNLLKYHVINVYLYIFILLYLDLSLQPTYALNSNCKDICNNNKFCILLCILYKKVNNLKYSGILFIFSNSRIFR